MYELHENEQYFFAEETLEELSVFLSRFSSVCCICAPLLGRRLEEMGCRVAILDIDERFRDLKGFVHYDLYRPRWLGEDYEIVFCDPPFFNVSLSQLFSALRMLSLNRYNQPLMVSYLKRREDAIVGTFSRFGLEPTGYEPRYQTVPSCEKNRIEIYSNLSDFTMLRNSP